DLAERRRAEYAAHIHSAGRHLLNLVNDALDLSAVEAGHLTLNEEVFDLERLLDEIVPMVAQRAKDAEVSLSRQRAPAGRGALASQLLADERCLRQVII